MRARRLWGRSVLPYPGFPKLSPLGAAGKTNGEQLAAMLPKTYNTEIVRMGQPIGEEDGQEDRAK
jgi:hypothetical protein